jgi:hypothetical protein
MLPYAMCELDIATDLPVDRSPLQQHRDGYDWLRFKIYTVGKIFVLRL